MARSQAGGRLNKLLNFIGLVDEDASRNNEELLSERQSYGRGSTYTPRNARTAQHRTVNEARGVDVRRSPYSSAAQRRRETDPYRNDAQSGRASNRYAGSGRSELPAARSASGNNRFARSRYEEEAYERSGEANAPAVRESRPVPQQRMVMLSMQRLEDCCDVIDRLIAGNMVLVTLEDMDPKQHQRARDTLSGAVYALNAKIRKASERTYLLTPGSVDLDDAEFIVRGF